MLDKKKLFLFSARKGRATNSGDLITYALRKSKYALTLPELNQKLKEMGLQRTEKNIYNQVLSLRKEEKIKGYRHKNKTYYYVV